MNPLQERLQAFLNHEDISLRAFERQCDIKAGTASKMTERSYGTTFHKIAKAYPQLNVEWLKTGDGQMLNAHPAVDIDLDLKLGGHSQFAMRDITNIGDAKTQMLLLRERIKLLEKELHAKQSELEEKDKRIDELNVSLERERKMNDYLMGQK